MKTHAWLTGAVLFASIAGCRGTTSKDPPVYGIRNMYDQPKYDVQEESNFFPDHRTMRPLVDGVISAEEEVDPVIAQGRLEDGSGYVLEIPKQVYGNDPAKFDAFVKRGRERYNIFCMPCHAETGSGYGLVRKRAVAGGAAAFVPPTFHQERLRKIPDGQLFATISNGKNNMPPYAMQIQPADRWAIVAWVRSLQIAYPKPEGVPLEDSNDKGAKTAPMAPMAPSTDAGSDAAVDAGGRP